MNNTLTLNSKERLACWKSVERSLEILSNPNPDFSELQDVLSPLMISSVYSVEISKLYQELVSETYSIDDAIEIFECIYNDFL